MSSKEKTDFEEKAMCRKMFGEADRKVNKTHATNTHRKPLPKSASTVNDKYRKYTTMTFPVPQQFSSDVNNNVNIMARTAARCQPVKKLQVNKVHLSPVQSKKFTTGSTESYHKKISASSDGLKNWNIDDGRKQG